MEMPIFPVRRSCSPGVKDTKKPPVKGGLMQQRSFTDAGLPPLSGYTEARLPPASGAAPSLLPGWPGKPPPEPDRTAYRPYGRLRRRSCCRGAQHGRGGRWTSHRACRPGQRSAPPAEYVRLPAHADNRSHPIFRGASACRRMLTASICSLERWSSSVRSDTFASSL